MLLALEALPEPGFGGREPALSSLSDEAAAALNQAWLGTVRRRSPAIAAQSMSRVVQPGRDACGHRVRGQDGAGMGFARGAADLRRPRRASGSGHSASFSPDGTHVVTASEDKTARVWDLRGGAAELRRPRGHQSRSCSARIQPDGTRVVTASRTRRRGCGTARRAPSFVALEGHQGPVDSASFSADGTHVVTASGDETARVWDCASEQPTSSPSRGIRVGRFRLVQPGRNAMSSPRLMTRRRGCGICATERPSFVALEGMRVRSISASFSPDGTHVVTASHGRHGAGMGFARRASQLRRPRRASGTGQLGGVQRGRDACGHRVI